GVAVVDALEQVPASVGLDDLESWIDSIVHVVAGNAARHEEIVDQRDESAFAGEVAIESEPLAILHEKMLGVALPLEPELEHLAGGLDRMQRDECVADGFQNLTPSQIAQGPPAQMGGIFRRLSVGAIDPGGHEGPVSGADVVGIRGGMRVVEIGK